MNYGGRGSNVPSTQLGCCLQSFDFLVLCPEAGAHLGPVVRGPVVSELFEELLWTKFQAEERSRLKLGLGRWRWWPFCLFCHFDCLDHPLPPRAEGQEETEGRHGFHEATRERD